MRNVYSLNSLSCRRLLLLSASNGPQCCCWHVELLARDHETLPLPLASSATRDLAKHRPSATSSAYTGRRAHPGVSHRWQGKPPKCGDQPQRQQQPTHTAMGSPGHSRAAIDRMNITAYTHRRGEPRAATVAHHSAPWHHGACWHVCRFACCDRNARPTQPRRQLPCSGGRIVSHRSCENARCLRLTA